MTLREFLFYNKISVVKFCNDNNLPYQSIIWAMNNRTRISVELAVRIQDITNDIVQPKDWVYHEDVLKDNYSRNLKNKIWESETIRLQKSFQSNIKNVKRKTEKDPKDEEKQSQ